MIVLSPTHRVSVQNYKTICDQKKSLNSLEFGNLDSIILPKTADEARNVAQNCTSKMGKNQIIFGDPNIVKIFLQKGKTSFDFY